MNPSLCPSVGRSALVIAAVSLLPAAAQLRAQVVRSGSATVGAGGSVSGVNAREALPSDPDFQIRVARPANTSSHPKLLYDEGHNNLYSSSEGFQAFARLAAADGYSFEKNGAKLDRGRLSGVAVLVIADARGGVAEGAGDAALTNDEVDAVAQYVEGGGSLLLVVNEGTFASSAENLAAKLGVTASAWLAKDSLHYDVLRNNQTYLVFSKATGLLGSHPILAGRDSSERIATVESFAGASLAGPAGAEALLRMSETAFEQQGFTQHDRDSMLVAMRQQLLNRGSGGAMSSSIRMVQHPKTRPSGPAQGLAFERGKGRVVVVGDATMLTAVIKTPMDGGTPSKIGLSIPGVDNQQFALNVLHWLSRVL